MAYEILTDTSSDLLWDMYRDLNIGITPLSVNIGGEEFTDDESVNPKDFYGKLRTKIPAHTSQVTSVQFTEFFEETLKRGNDVFYLGLSASLSGTCNSACVARDELLEKYPDRKIYVADSASVTLGSGIMLLALCDIRDKNGSLEDVIAFYEENRLRVHHLFTVSDLMFLFRGGRLPRTSAIMGTMLGMKPVLHVTPDGKLTAHGKVRGRKPSLDALVKEMGENSDTKEFEYIGIVHGDCVEDAEYVLSQIRESFTVKNPVINFLCPTVGCHSGPGTIALFFFGKERE